MASVIRGLVSTITPVHNRSELVMEAVRSVLAQTHQPVECIVVDDGSTDDTPAVLDALAAEEPERVKVIHKANSGPGCSREEGRRLARGEFVQYLDSDDVLAPQKFELQIAALRTNPEAALCYGITEYHRIGQEDRRKVFATTDRPVARIFPAFLVRRRWGTSSPLYRRSVTDRIGPWGAMWSEEDWEYDCRIGALGSPVAYVREVVSCQRGLVGRRLSQQGRNDARTLSSQSRARQLIRAHAGRAGVEDSAPEMQLFLRSLFLLARDCGGAGLVEDAMTLCSLVTQKAEARGLRRSVAAYQAAARVVGWRLVSRMSRSFERVRR